MKKRHCITIFAGLLLAGTTQAHDITITGWKSYPLPSFFLPKVASDGQNTVVTIAENGTSFSPLETEFGQYTDVPKGVSWAGPASIIYSPSKQEQKGLAPSIALAFDFEHQLDVIIEEHQGGQNGGSSLWFQMGSIPLPLSKINWEPAVQLGPGPRSVTGCAYSCPVPPVDYGYNPTVAADLDGSSHTFTTVVEVHEGGDGYLYYHVGALALGATPSITLANSSLAVSGTFQGYAPTVSISGNVAVLVAQGSGGTLWYSIGVVDPVALTIAWSTPTSYGSGYSPAVSVYGNGGDVWVSGRVLVEAHQVDSGTGSLVYSVGVLDPSSPTSITWSTNNSGMPTPYATGCSPSVALAFSGYSPTSGKSQVSVTETHTAMCGSARMTESLFGQLAGR